MAAYALIAEPDPSQSQLYTHLAKAEGFEVRVARDGATALSMVRQHGAPALTITELSLARLDGFRLIEEIRKLSPEEYAKVVVISAFRALRDAAVAQKERLGISALLARSAPVDSISRALKKVLASSASPHGPSKEAASAPPPPTMPKKQIDEERAEEVRLHRLDQLQLVDKGDEQDDELRAIVEGVAKKFSVPVALISLVLEDRQWFKAHVGLSGHLLANRGSQRDWSFCTHVVQGRLPLVIPDAAVHPAFAQNPLVVEGAVRSYAGVPLETAAGDVLGSLCIIDRKPMSISAEDVDRLGLLARNVAGELELRSARKRETRDRDLLHPRQAEQIDRIPELRTALAYLSAVLDNIDNGVFLLDPQRRVVFVNQAAADMFSRTIDSLIGKHRDEVVKEAAALMADPEDFLRRVKQPESGAYAARGEFELEKPRRRFIRWTAKPVPIEGGIGQLGVMTDVTSEVDLSRERDTLARTDPVTSLMNRRGAEELLEREAARAQRFGLRVSLVLFDLDHFKQINDRHGHDAGDEALRAVAQTLLSAMRGVDAAARWGGDELLAILPATGADGARSFAERVRHSVEQLDQRIIHGATLSSGVAELQPGEDWSDAIRRADSKLYEAKEAGRNRVA
jgi:diguanylate cyclase (GGDEF)-like protein/PAS domain S-box-containing protein